MNWLDFLIIAVLLITVLWGFITGLIDMVVTAVGAMLGWWLAGQYAGELSGMIGLSQGSAADTIVSSIAYPLIIAVVGAVVYLAGKILRPFIMIGTLGMAAMADKLGGLIVGLLIGLIASIALITMMGRLAYDFSLPSTQIAPARELLANVENSRGAVRRAMSGSVIVGGFLTVRDALPDAAFDFIIPDDFSAALDLITADDGR